MKPQATSVNVCVSQLSVQASTTGVGDYAHQAIQKYVNHICRQEKGVLAHGDPEFLHQMRVGLRRLRTVCGVFSFAIAIPFAFKRCFTRPPATPD